MLFSPLKPIFNLHTIYESPINEQVYEIKWSHCWRVNVGEIRHRRTPALHGPILLHNNTTTLIPYSSIFHPASAAYTCSGCVCVSSHSPIIPLLSRCPLSDLLFFLCVLKFLFICVFSSVSINCSSGPRISPTIVCTFVTAHITLQGLVFVLAEGGSSFLI